MQEEREKHQLGLSIPKPLGARLRTEAKQEEEKTQTSILLNEKTNERNNNIGMKPAMGQDSNDKKGKKDN